MTPAVRAALAVLESAAVRAENAAQGASDPWAWLLGADSTTAALRSNADAARKLYRTMEAKAERIQAGTPEEADFVRVAQEHGDPSEAERLSSFLTPWGAAKDVGGATARDVASAVRFGLPLVAIVALVVGAIYFLPRGAR